MWDDTLLKGLCTVPGLGRVKAKVLLTKFKNYSGLCKASEQVGLKRLLCGEHYVHTNMHIWLPALVDWLTVEKTSQNIVSSLWIDSSHSTHLFCLSTISPDLKFAVYQQPTAS